MKMGKYLYLVDMEKESLVFRGRMSTGFISDVLSKAKYDNLVYSNRQGVVGRVDFNSELALEYTQYLYEKDAIDIDNYRGQIEDISRDIQRLDNPIYLVRG